MPEAVLPVGAHLSTRHVFVYGTLRRGDDNDITRLLPAPRFEGNGAINGVMYHLGAYPGVVMGTGIGFNKIVGEVYAIEPELERVLDEIEELYPQQRDEYRKRYTPVSVNGLDLICLVYEINTAYVVGRPVISSGDWVKSRRGQVA